MTGCGVFVVSFSPPDIVFTVPIIYNMHKSQGVRGKDKNVTIPIKEGGGGGPYRHFR